jgi:hypothetical protein
MMHVQKRFALPPLQMGKKSAVVWVSSLGLDQEEIVGGSYRCCSAFKAMLEISQSVPLVPRLAQSSYFGIQMIRSGN